MSRRWHLIRLFSLLAWVFGLTLGAVYLMGLYPEWKFSILLATLVLTFVFIVIDLVERDRALNRGKNHGREEKD